MTTMYYVTYADIAPATTVSSPVSSQPIALDTTRAAVVVSDDDKGSKHIDSEATNRSSTGLRGWWPRAAACAKPFSAGETLSQLHVHNVTDTF